jgi:putative transcriptional regulator
MVIDGGPVVVGVESTVLDLSRKPPAILRPGAITQEDLASSLGVTRQTILAIENGKYNPSLELAFKMAKYFETTIEQVFNYKEDIHN